METTTRTPSEQNIVQKIKRSYCDLCKNVEEIIFYQGKSKWVKAICTKCGQRVSMCSFCNSIPHDSNIFRLCHAEIENASSWNSETEAWFCSNCSASFNGHPICIGKKFVSRKQSTQMN